LDRKDLTRRGAIARLAELKGEEAAICARSQSCDEWHAGIAYTDDGTTALPGRKTAPSQAGNKERCMKTILRMLLLVIGSATLASA
jgi:hypothetical protein